MSEVENETPVDPPTIAGIFLTKATGQWELHIQGDLDPDVIQTALSTALRNHRRINDLP